MMVADTITGNMTGIVYGAQSGIMRRVILPERDDALAQASLVGDGESILVVERDRAPNPETAQQALTEYLGYTPHSGRCAVIDNGVVESMIMADPALYSLPGKTLVLCADTVGAGFTYDAATKAFTAPPQPDESEGG